MSRLSGDGRSLRLSPPSTSSGSPCVCTLPLSQCMLGNLPASATLNRMNGWMCPTLKQSTCFYRRCRNRAWRPGRCRFMYSRVCSHISVMKNSPSGVTAVIKLPHAAAPGSFQRRRLLHNQPLVTAAGFMLPDCSSVIHMKTTQ